jgi:BlaI family penicillinase repressor
MPELQLAITEAEWLILKAVWSAEPCTAPQIQQDLRTTTNWTYSTVRTLMDRMVGKKLLKSEKGGKVTTYRSVVTRAQAQRSELVYALQNAFNGALTPMIQCLLDTKSLSQADLDELELLIKAKKKGARKA